MQHHQRRSRLESDHANHVDLFVEPLESRTLLTTIQIFAAGDTGQEQMELWIAGEHATTFNNVGGNVALGEYEEFTYDTQASATRFDVELRFTNDLYDPANGVDRNLTVSRIAVDGITFSAASPDVYSTGTYQNGLRVSGFGVGNRLYTNGVMQWGATDGSLLTIYADGTTGEELFDVYVKGEHLYTHSTNDGPGIQTYFVKLNQFITADDVRISFVNDLYDPASNIDRNLVVDRIELDSVTYQTESAFVYSTGTYVHGEGISPGFRQSETLHANGYFQYSTSDPNVDNDPRAIVLLNDSTSVSQTSVNFNLSLTLDLYENTRSNYSSNSEFEQALLDGVTVVSPDAQVVSPIVMGFVVISNLDNFASIRYGFGAEGEVFTVEENGEYQVFFDESIFWAGASTSRLLGTVLVDTGVPSQSATSQLEDARGDVRVFENRSGDLRIVGNQNDNVMRIQQIGDQTVIFDPTGSTTFNGSSRLTLNQSSYRRLKINTRGGHDSVEVVGGSYQDINVRTGSGSDAFTVTAATRIDGALKLALGSGQDAVSHSESDNIIPQVGRIVFRGTEVMFGERVIDLTKTRFHLSGEEVTAQMD